MQTRKAVTASGRPQGQTRTQRGRAAAVLAAALAAGLASLAVVPTAAQAIEPETCTTAVGEAIYVMAGERQRVSERLSTNLEESQHFVFTWANGEERVELVELKSASCTVNERGTKRFVGEGTATLNGEPGYTIRFSIIVTARGANTISVRIFEGREKILTFRDSALTGQTIS
jgi:hypothetical protein